MLGGGGGCRGPIQLFIPSTHRGFGNVLGGRGDTWLGVTVGLQGPKQRPVGQGTGRMWPGGDGAAAPPAPPHLPGQ